MVREGNNIPQIQHFHVRFPIVHSIVRTLLQLTKPNDELFGVLQVEIRSRSYSRGQNK